jgi:tetratricopeptide (TPR) repeat protein
MESLKYLIAFVILGLSITVHGQYSEKILKAFEKSYIAEKAGDFKEAASCLRETYQEDSYEFNLRLGWLLFKNRQLDESKNYYQKALTLLPYSEEAKFGIILPLAAKSDWNEVIRYYNLILDNNPGNTIALYRLGLVFYERKEWSQAVRCFQKLVDLYPFDYDGLLMLAWTNLQLGKSREAKILFNKVILWSPGDKSALEGLKLLK